MAVEMTHFLIRRRQLIQQKSKT